LLPIGRIEPHYVFDMAREPIGDLAGIAPGKGVNQCEVDVVVCIVAG
jgi:hypothetical protein